MVQLVLLAQRLTGKRAALVAGVTFAALAPTPFLVGWVSGVQDLLGMVFILGALHFQLSRRTAAAMVFTALSLLSKETAIAVVPALAALDWILRRPPYRLRRQFMLYGVLVILWAAVHPGVQRLLAHGLGSGATGYVGAEHPERWLPYLGRYVLTLANIPTAPADPMWILEQIPALVLALLVLLFGLVVASRHQGEPETQAPASPGRLMLLGGLLAGLPLTLVSTMLRGWAPYYAVYPAMGSSLALGALATRLPERQVNLALVAFLVVGCAGRAGTYDPGAPTEYNLGTTSRALRKVEAGFKALETSLPRGTQVLVSVQTQGLAGVHTHLFLFQALRVWYRDPTLATMRPDWRRPAPAAERLFWVSPGADVFEIDLRTKGAHSGGPQPNYVQYQKTLRYYARGLTATGDIFSGLHVLLRMPEPDYSSWVLDRHLAAMLLYAIGRDQDAAVVLRQVPNLSRADARGAIGALLGSPSPGLPWDDAAFKAFAISTDDVDAWRQLMRGSATPIYAADAIRFARRVLRLVPGDAEASATIRRLSGYEWMAAISRPAPPDSL